MRKALPKKAELVYRDRPWILGPVLDQSATRCPGASVYPQNDHSFCNQYGFCVGYSVRSWVEAQPVRTKFGPSALDIYHNAQLNDEWDGTSYGGTSVRGAMKWLSAVGRVAQYVWAEGAQDVADYVRTQGTVIVGTNWLSNMFWPDKSTGYVLDCSGSVAGGHAYQVVWYYKRVTLADDKSYKRIFVIKNSWGDWGNGGLAYMRLEDLDRLIRDGGEAVAALEKKP
jgi:hypothetical protein